MHRTGETKGAAAGYLGLARRVMAPPEVAAALAMGTVLRAKNEAPYSSSHRLMVSP